ncbi:MAG: hypothetical protein U1C46_01920 [Bacteroidales bacterium]|nr:hypothetical protein [Bacteroidales bacterium]MDZ4203552.1 hypothetical protein [Bacteroidales bacterium]
MILRKIVILLTSICISLIVKAGKPVSPDIRLFTSGQIDKALEMIYSFNFKEAASLADQIGFEKDIEKELAELNLLWWQGLTYGVDNRFLKDLTTFSETLIESKPDIHTIAPRQVFLILLAGTYRIRLAAIENDKTAALRTFIKITPGLKAVLAKSFEYEEYALLAGVYNYTVGGVKNNYILLRPFFVFLPQANADTGRELLQKCAGSQDLTIATEAHYFLYKIEYEVFNNQVEAEKHLMWLTRKYPENIIFKLDLLRMYTRDKKSTSDLRQDIENTIQRSQLSKDQKDYLRQILSGI